MACGLLLARYLRRLNENALSARYTREPYKRVSNGGIRDKVLAPRLEKNPSRPR